MSLLLLLWRDDEKLSNRDRKRDDDDDDDALLLLLLSPATDVAGLDCGGLWRVVIMVVCHLPPPPRNSMYVKDSTPFLVFGVTRNLVLPSGTLLYQAVPNHFRHSS